jgi:lipoyl(octanoyl) transferase
MFDKMPSVKKIDLGLIDFKQAWDYQEKLFDEIVNQKIANRSIENKAEHIPSNHYLIFCEHPHVYTLGKSGHENNMLANAEMLKQQNATYYRINRGGDITYHGPGQIVGYPILDLDYFFTDIHKYLRFLEEVVILTLADYGIAASRSKGETGVWLDENNPALARKICALGVRASRWVTMHGFALNVNANLNYFNNIIPCGIKDKAVTSLNKELGRDVPLDEVKNKLSFYFGKIFDCELI